MVVSFFHACKHADDSVCIRLARLLVNVFTVHLSYSRRFNHSVVYFSKGVPAFFIN